MNISPLHIRWKYYMQWRIQGPPTKRNQRPIFTIIVKNVFSFSVCIYSILQNTDNGVLQKTSKHYMISIFDIKIDGGFSFHNTNSVLIVSSMKTWKYDGNWSYLYGVAWHDMTDNYLLMQWDNSYWLTHAHFGIYDFMRFISWQRISICVMPLLIGKQCWHIQISLLSCCGLSQHIK